MNGEQLEIRRIFEAIDEKTDMMLNAILVDEFEVFESNLEIREKLFEDYEAQKSLLDEDALKALDVQTFFRKISKVDQKIKIELNRFQADIKEKQLENKREQSGLISNVKKTNQYHFVTEATSRGHLFDKKK